MRFGIDTLIIIHHPIRRTQVDDRNFSMFDQHLLDILSDSCTYGNAIAFVGVALHGPLGTLSGTGQLQRNSSFRSAEIYSKLSQSDFRQALIANNFVQFFARLSH